MSTKVHESIGRVTHIYTQVESRNNLGLVGIHQNEINNIFEIYKVSLYHLI